MSKDGSRIYWGMQSRHRRLLWRGACRRMDDHLSQGAQRRASERPISRSLSQAIPRDRSCLDEFPSLFARSMLPALMRCSPYFMSGRAMRSRHVTRKNAPPFGWATRESNCTRISTPLPVQKLSQRGRV
ncbi:hypothetical protein V8C34DRAFT_165226 [Trichoderma compactum]